MSYGNGWITVQPLHALAVVEEFKETAKCKMQQQQQEVNMPIHSLEIYNV